MSTETLLEEPELSDSLRRLCVSPFNSWRYAIIWLVLISPLLVRVMFFSKAPASHAPDNTSEIREAAISTAENNEAPVSPVFGTPATAAR